MRHVADRGRIDRPSSQGANGRGTVRAVVVDGHGPRLRRRMSVRGSRIADGDVGSVVLRTLLIALLVLAAGAGSGYLVGRGLF